MARPNSPLLTLVAATFLGRGSLPVNTSVHSIWRDCAPFLKIFYLFYETIKMMHLLYVQYNRDLSLGSDNLQLWNKKAIFVSSLNGLELALTSVKLRKLYEYGLLGDHL